MSSTIALIAHDGKKDDMIRFARTHGNLLSQFRLIATGTTGSASNKRPGYRSNAC